MKSFNKRLIAFKNKTKMDGRSLAKLFGCSQSSISNFLNGKASPRRARREKILNYMDNCFVLPTAYNEIVSPPVVEEKTIRDAQVGDVVVGKNSKNQQMVLERWQNTVLLSYNNDFKKANSATYTFDELEEYFILKTEPVAEVVDKTASREKVINDLCKVLNIRNMTAREISSILEEIEKLNEKD